MLTRISSVKDKIQEGNFPEALDGVIYAVFSLVDIRDPYTVGHQQRVGELAWSIAKQIGLSDSQIRDVYVAGCLHDIGKVSVPLNILNKPSKLNISEFDIIKKHCQVGHDILKKNHFPQRVNEAILQHHERLDGSGYPNRLFGQEIMIEARILSVADVVDAMTSHRPYRPALGLKAALSEIRRWRGILYDACIVNACLKLLGNYAPVYGELISAAVIA